MMKKLMSVLFLALAITACGPSGSSQPTTTPTSVAAGINDVEAPSTPVSNPQDSSDEECENAYYPVVDGATWMYTLAGAIESTSTLNTHPVEENEFKVTTSSVDGTSQQTGHCTEQGIAFWDEAGLSALFQSGAGTSTASTLQSTGVSLPHEIEPGDTWNQTLSAVGSDTDGIVSVNAEFEAQGYETISVPAGDFDTLRILRTTTVLFQGNEILEKATEWYARDVGLVKRVTSITGMPELPLELVSYDIPDN
jgi:hypothetical protein